MVWDRVSDWERQWNYCQLSNTTCIYMLRKPVIHVHVQNTHVHVYVFPCLQVHFNAKPL